MRKILFASFILWLGALYAHASEKVEYTPKDKEIYNSYMEWIKKEKKPADSTGSLLVKTAKYFLNTPYVAATLDKNKTEKLVVNLRELDCTTFMETCVALVKTVQSKNTSFENYCSILQKLRYRDGLIDGYNSRLHYMRDWIYNNQQMGIVEDISLQLGGKAKEKEINFMSKNAEKYEFLKNNLEEIKKMQDIEKVINSRHDYYVIHTSLTDKNRTQIQDGDIILFVSNLTGLDYHHVALAYRTTKGVCFIHASLKEKKVVIEENTIHKYVSKSKRDSEVSLLRVL